MEPNETTNPPLGAGPVNDTVHDDDMESVIFVGLQLTPESATGRTIVRVAGEPTAVTGDPVGSTASTFNS